MAKVSDKLAKQGYLFLAKTAEQAELYKDMFSYAELLMHVDPSLTREERLVFCSASKHVIQIFRKSVSALDEYQKSEKASLTKIYKTTVETKTSDFCEKVLNILENHLIPSAGEDKESMLNYLTMEGDFYRYMAEVKSGNEKDMAAERAEKAYVTAKELAEKNFKPIDRYRLVVALNFSVFCYENLGDKNRGIGILKEAFDEACADHVSDKQNYKDSFVIMGVMQQNLFNWKISNYHSRINNYYC